jgi:hypothetical protein
LCFGKAVVLKGGGFFVFAKPAESLQDHAMFSAKQLSEDQVSAIKSWAVGGAQLPDIQLRMKEEFKLSLTYMDTRFLVLDLGIELVEEKKDEPVAEVKPAPVPTGEVSVTMDGIALPGAALAPPCLRTSPRTRAPSASVPVPAGCHAGMRCCLPGPIRSARPMRRSVSRNNGQLLASW